MSARTWNLVAVAVCLLATVIGFALGLRAEFTFCVGLSVGLRVAR